MCLLTLLAFAFSIKCYFTSPTLILVRKHDKRNLNHTFSYTLKFWKYLFFKIYSWWLYVFLNTFRVNVVELAIFVYFARIFILCTWWMWFIYLFVYFYFPFPSILFSPRVNSMMNIQFETRFSILTTKFCRPQLVSSTCISLALPFPLFVSQV